MKDFSKGLASGSAVTTLATSLGYFGYKKSQERRELRYAKYGLPKRQVPSTLSYSNHALHYDEAKKIPLWVSEHITPYTVKECLECVSLSVPFGTMGESVSRSKASFKPDPAIPKSASATNEDYRRSGYSRGHMAPAGDNKHSQAAMNDTFLLTNILPQEMKNNGGYWNMMELFARDLTAKVSDVYVISGPVFRPEKDGDQQIVKYQVIGGNRVAVPTHLFKVVLAETESGPVLSAFVVPNHRLPLQTPLKEYKVELEELEREIGFSLLPKLPRESYKDLCTSHLGCDLMPLRDFLRIIYERHIAGSRRLFWLERQWAKAQRDSMDTDPALRAQYEAKKRELEEKEAARISTPAPA